MSRTELLNGWEDTMMRFAVESEKTEETQKQKPRRPEQLASILRDISACEGRDKEATVAMYEAEMQALLESFERPFVETAELMLALAQSGESGLLDAMTRLSGMHRNKLGFRVNGCDDSNGGIKNGGRLPDLDEDEKIEQLVATPDGSNVQELLAKILKRVSCSKGDERVALVEYYAPTLISFYVAQNRHIREIAQHLVTMAYRNTTGLQGSATNLLGQSDYSGEATFGFLADRN